MTSKSFRAVLPRLSDDELERLRAWSAEFCAAGAVFREGDAVIWLASKERARNREAFMRSARGTLERLAIRAKPRTMAGPGRRGHRALRGLEVRSGRGAAAGAVFRCPRGGRA